MIETIQLPLVNYSSIKNQNKKSGWWVRIDFLDTFLFCFDLALLADLCYLFLIQE